MKRESWISSVVYIWQQARPPFFLFYVRDHGRHSLSHASAFLINLFPAIVNLTSHLPPPPLFFCCFNLISFSVCEKSGSSRTLQTFDSKVRSVETCLTYFHQNLTFNCIVFHLCWNDCVDFSFFIYSQWVVIRMDRYSCSLMAMSFIVGLHHFVNLLVAVHRITTKINDSDVEVSQFLRITIWKCQSLTMRSSFFFVTPSDKMHLSSPKALYFTHVKGFHLWRMAFESRLFFSPSQTSDIPTICCCEIYQT